MTDTSSISQLLQAINTGDQTAEQQLLPLIYGQLKRMAARRMSDERDDHTLSPTALVHEAYLRLLGDEVQWQHRRHFFAAAAKAMRRVLIEHARKHQAAKRGGGWFAVTFDEDALCSRRTGPEELLALDQSIKGLCEHDTEMAQIVMLRFFGGFANVEIARIMDCSERTVIRKWMAARAWIGSHTN